MCFSECFVKSGTKKEVKTLVKWIFHNMGPLKKLKKSTACRSCIPSSPAGPSWDSQGRGNHQCRQSCGTTGYSGCDSDESDVSPARNRRFTFAVQSSGPSAVPGRSSLCSAEPPWEKNISAITFKLICYLFWWHFQGLLNIFIPFVREATRRMWTDMPFFQHFLFFSFLFHIEGSLKNIHERSDQPGLVGELGKSLHGVNNQRFACEGTETNPSNEWLRFLLKESSIAKVYT